MTRNTMELGFFLETCARQGIEPKKMTTALLTRQNVIKHAGHRLARRSLHLLRVVSAARHL